MLKPSFRPRPLSVIAVIIVALAILSGSEASDLPQQIAPTLAAYRMPVGLVWQQDRLFVANARTGSISTIDVNAGSVKEEWKVADSLSAIAAWRDGLLVLDDQQHRLLQLIPDIASGEMNITASIEVAKYPVDVAVNANQSIVAVSSLWSHQMTILECTDTRLSVRSQIEVPFALRKLLFVTDHQLVVADAFGGNLAVVDCSTGRITNQHAVYGHNISGLSLDQTGTKLLATCQTLDAGTFTSYERVFWGVVMQNGLHSMLLQPLLNSGGQIENAVAEESNYDGSSYTSPNQYPLGTPSIGSGELVVTQDDTTLLLLSGVNQMAFRTTANLPFERLKTGRRPEAICLDKNERHAYIANRFDDSITVIGLTGDSPAVDATIALGSIRELSLAEQGEQGEQTFYDATVSLDGWFSCHSCHTNGHTNGLRADTFGDEDRGAPKKVMSLLGIHDTGPWAWNGRKETLEEQIKTSLVISMQTQTESDSLPIRPLAAYLNSLQPPPSLTVAQARHPSEELLKLAQRDFVSAGCSDCHSGEALTSDGRYDVGIHDEQGETMFNPPSLRGVSQRPPFFHDGRAATLTDVLKSSHHDQENPLTDEQVERLVILLETL